MASTNNITPQTPIHQSNQIVNDLLHQLNTNGTQETMHDRPTPANITESQLHTLLQCFREQQTMIDELMKHQNASQSAMVAKIITPAKAPDYYNNARYEDIICKPIKPVYDGTADQLVPFLNRLDIRRQDESWYPITFINIGDQTYDLLRHFAKIDESVIIHQAKTRWESVTLLHDKFSLEHPTYNARVLARLLLGSLTDEFCLTIIHRIHQDYRKDGVVILWTICNNIHRNNIAFVETIKGKIRDSVLSAFQDDVSKYIMHIKDNLTLITSSEDKEATEHNDLIIHLFQQLKKSPVPLFKEAIDKWHVKYLEAKMPQLTPLGLLKLADDKIQILKHAGNWTVTEDPAIMALKLELQQQKQESDKLVKHLVAHVSRITNRTRQHIQQNHINNHTGQKHSLHDQKFSSNYPPWMIVPPTHPAETKLVDKKIYTWCTKCRQGQGLWVCRHNTETHIDGYTPQRHTRRRVDFELSPTQHDRRFQNVTNIPRQQHDQHKQISSTRPSPPHHTAQLSLLGYLDDYLPTDESQADHEPGNDTIDTLE
jgi:hypothetical protein